MKQLNFLSVVSVVPVRKSKAQANTFLSKNRRSQHYSSLGYSLFTTTCAEYANEPQENLVRQQPWFDGSVSHQAARCGFIFMSHINTWMYCSRGMQEQLPSGSIANKNRAADGRLKAHPKGINQHLQPSVIAVRHGTTMASRQCLVLNALVYAAPSKQGCWSTR